jgi:hypothetical protein
MKLVAFALLMAGCTQAGAHEASPAAACVSRFVAATEACKAEITFASDLVGHAVERQQRAELAPDPAARSHALQMVDAEYRHVQAVSRICNSLVGIK